MNFFKALSHEAKVILSVIGSGFMVLASSGEMLTALITKPWRESIPEVLPKIVAAGAAGGALYNMQPKKDGEK